MIVTECLSFFDVNFTVGSISPSFKAVTLIAEQYGTIPEVSAWNVIVPCTLSEFMIGSYSSSFTQHG